jgi:hypothetical protein
MDDFDALLRRQDEQIARVGWAVTAVLPTDDYPGTPFAYTVGLTARFTDRVGVGIGTDLGKHVLNASVTCALRSMEGGVVMWTVVVTRTRVLAPSNGHRQGKPTTACDDPLD